MRTVKPSEIIDALCNLCGQITHKLPDDVLAALKNAQKAETNPRAQNILAQLIENAALADEKSIPLCQDTGLAIVFAEIGQDIAIEKDPDNPDQTVSDIINQGIAQGYEKGFLRKSVVEEPLKDRKNTQTNTPAVIHQRIVPGDKLTLHLMAKGGGCENKSRFKMFNPTETMENVCEWIVQVVKDAGANACPPFVVGVGIGGSFEQSAILSKQSLLNNISEKHPDAFYAQMESFLLSQINRTGLGPQGLGGDTTALAVHIKTAPCHIASLPVSVNIECHSHRHATIIL